MHLITDHDGDVLAIASHQVFLAPHVEQLAPGHPLRRLTGALCLYARAVYEGVEPTPFDAQRARRFARELLIAPEALPPGGYDADVARRLAVPIELVRERRRDLGQAPCWPTPAVSWASDADYRRWRRGSR